MLILFILTIFVTCLNFFSFRHCPQAKHTAVADTPEIRRLAENTKLQSNVSIFYGDALTIILCNKGKENNIKMHLYL